MLMITLYAKQKNSDLILKYVKDHQRESNTGTRYRFCMCTRVSCLPPRDPVDCNPPGSSIQGILRARILEWILCPHPGDLPNPGTELTFRVSPVAHVHCRQILYPLNHLESP